MNKMSLVDQGWSWLVCLGVFVSLSMETGMLKALGVMLPVLQQEFATKAYIIGFIISLLPGVGAIACPVAGALSKRFSTRSTVMIFNALSAIGLIVASVVTSVKLLSLCFLLTGLSIGAGGVLSGELAVYFKKYFDIATAISFAGFSVGIIVMPMLTQFLTDVYGCRGAILILGGINLHSIISGALLRPVIPTRPLSDEKKVLNGSNALTMDPAYNTDSKLCSRYMLSSFVYYLDLQLFNKPIFVTRIVYSLGCGYSLTGWVIYLVPFAESVGISPYHAAFLSTCGGFGSLLGTGVFPLLNRNFPSEYLIYSVAIICCSTLMLMPFLASYNSYLGLVFASLAFGLVRIGVLSGFQIVKDNTNADQLSNAFMWLFMAYSIGSILSGFLSGWIFDQTGSYTVSFLTLGMVALLSVTPQLYIDQIRRSKHLQYSSIQTKE